MHFNENCTDISFGDAKILTRFCDLDPIFQGHRRTKNVEKCLE